MAQQCNHHLTSTAFVDELHQQSPPPHHLHQCCNNNNDDNHEGEVSGPRDPAEPHTPVEAPLQSSSPFVILPPRYSLLHPMEHCTSSTYSNYVPLCLQLLFPSHPGMFTPCLSSYYS